MAIFDETINPELADAIYDAAHTCGCGHSKRMHYDGGCQIGRCKCDEFEPMPEPGSFDPFAHFYDC